MLGGRDLVGRACDQRGQVLAGEPTNLDAKALSLFVELRPVREASARRVKVSKLAARRRGRSPQTGRPSRRPGFADPGHSDNRMTLATYTRATEGMQDSATAALEETFLDPAVDMPLTKGSVSTARALCFSLICRTLISGGTRIRTGGTMIFSHVS